LRLHHGDFRLDLRASEPIYRQCRSGILPIRRAPSGAVDIPRSLSKIGCRADRAEPGCRSRHFVVRRADVISPSDGVVVDDFEQGVSDVCAGDLLARRRGRCAAARLGYPIRSTCISRRGKSERRKLTSRPWPRPAPLEGSFTCESSVSLAGAASGVKREMELFELA